MVTFDTIDLGTHKFVEHVAVEVSIVDDPDGGPSSLHVKADCGAQTGVRSLRLDGRPSGLSDVKCPKCFPTTNAVMD